MPAVDADAVELIRYGKDQLDAIRPTLVALYADVCADELSDPFFSVDRFEQRLNGQASLHGWEAVVAYDSGQAAGYAYASVLPEQAAWWSGMLEPLPADVAEETRERTLALFELMVRQPWRGTGVAERIHEELLRGRSAAPLHAQDDAAHAPAAIEEAEARGRNHKRCRAAGASCGGGSPSVDRPRSGILHVWH